MAERAEILEAIAVRGINITHGRKRIAEGAQLIGQQRCRVQEQLIELSDIAQREFAPLFNDPGLLPLVIGKDPRVRGLGTPAEQTRQIRRLMDLLLCDLEILRLGRGRVPAELCVEDGLTAAQTAEHRLDADAAVVTDLREAAVIQIVEGQRAFLLHEALHIRAIRRERLGDLIFQRLHGRRADAVLKGRIQSSRHSADLVLALIETVPQILGRPAGCRHKGEVRRMDGLEERQHRCKDLSGLGRALRRVHIVVHTAERQQRRAGGDHFIALFNAHRLEACLCAGLADHIGAHDLLRRGDLRKADRTVMARELMPPAGRLRLRDAGHLFLDALSRNDVAEERGRQEGGPGGHGHAGKQADQELGNVLSGDAARVCRCAGDRADQVRDVIERLSAGQLQLRSRRIVIAEFLIVARPHGDSLIIVQLLQRGVAVGLQFRRIGRIERGQRIGQIQHGVDMQIADAQRPADKGRHFQEAAAACAAADAADHIDLIVASANGRGQRIGLQIRQLLYDFHVHRADRIPVVDLEPSDQSLPARAAAVHIRDLRHDLRIGKAPPCLRIGHRIFYTGPRRQHQLSLLEILCAAQLRSVRIDPEEADIAAPGGVEAIRDDALDIVQRLNAGAAEANEDRAIHGIGPEKRRRVE